jgi:outer membrane receptor protein involved in Fe transport
MRTTARALAIAIACVVTQGALAEGTTRYEVKIEPQPIGAALKALAAQTGLQVLVMSEDAGEKRAPGVEGNLTNEEALAELLKDSGLTYQRIDGNTVAIVGVKESGKTASSRERVGRDRDSILIAQGGNASGADAAESTESSPLEEIVVTAQKRGQERLIEVPIPVTVLRTDQLAENNLVRMQDYYTRVPGFTVSPNAGRQQNLSLRGVSSGVNTTPTVGVMVDDVSFGGSSGAWGQVAPDFDPSELAQVEVLRGPQGTLYGSNSLGGLIRFVTIDPSTDAFSGRLQAGTAAVKNGDSPGYNIRGAVNAPLSDTLAIRASGFTREDPGYIDNPITGEDGVNEARITGGRFSMLWHPTDVFSVKLGAILEHTRQDSADTVVIRDGLGELKQPWLPNAGSYDRRLQAYSANLTLKLGAGELTALSGYSSDKLLDSFDTSELHGQLFTLPQLGVSGSRLLDKYQHDRFTQELRFSTPLSKSTTLLAGAFYSRETEPYTTQNVQGVDPSGAIVGSAVRLGHIADDGSHTEYAAFADLTVQFTDRFDVQFGGRQSWFRDMFFTDFIEGPLVGNVTLLTPPAPNAKAEVLTYLVTPRLKLSDDMMVYARVASGYRPGGGAPGRPADRCVQFNLPCQFKPDTTRNYEVGLKGQTADRMLNYDLSAYYIDWTDIQVNLLNGDNGFTYTANAGGAKNHGVEFLLEARPLSGMTLTASGAWSSTKLEVPSNAATANSGERMPFSPRFSGRLALDQEFSLMSLRTFMGGAVSYVGSRIGSFTSSSSPREIYPSYTQVDLNVGVRHDAWTANLFINNLTDERGLLGGGLGTSYNDYFFLIQPRTVGVSLAWTF